MARTLEAISAVASAATEPERRLGERAQQGALVAGTYRLVKHIGSGGMSDVFAAEHVRLGKAFAVKLLRPELSLAQKAADRLRREARAVAALSGEYIVGIQDCGETEDGTPFLVMELLDGEDLRTLLEREGRLPVTRAANLLLDACRGVAAAHARSLVHRDLKPENLFVTRHATGEDWCKVLDFGVAKMDASQSTAPGAIVGTIRYMAPEQLADSAAVGPKTDVYALGAVLYECLAGQAAHLGQGMQELMFQVMNGAPQPLTALRPGLPEGLAHLVMQCLEKAPSSRPALVELTQCLQGFARRVPPAAGEATLAEGVAPSSRLQGTPRRRGSRWVPALLLGCAGVGLGWATAASQPPAAPVTAAPRSGATVASAFVPSLPLAPPVAPLAPAATRDAEPETRDASVSSRPSASKVGAPRRRAPSPTAATATGGAAPSRATDVGQFDEANPYR